jgi:hypothetical protein
MPGRVFHFTYAVKPENPKYEDDDTTLRWERDLHLIRDASAFIELSETIFDAGYSWGDTVLNLYWEKGGQTPEPTNAPALEDGDLIVMTTRCPLHDHEDEETTKKIRRGHTKLEETVFHTVRYCFLEHSERGKISLAEPLRDFRKREGLVPGSFEFSKRTGEEKAKGTGKREEAKEEQEEEKAKGKHKKQILGFLLFAPHLIEKETKKRFKRKLLVSFGVAGVENLLWARTLRRLHSDLLSQIVKSDDFWCVIGRWDPEQSKAPRRPETLSFADGITLDLEVVACRLCVDQNEWQRAVKEGGAWQLLDNESPPKSKPA